MKIEDIRKDFPIVEDIIYFDNACMTISPKTVIDEINKYYNEFPVCGGSRSTHSLSNRLDVKIRKARRAIKDLINARENDQIIFTKNTTEAINLVAKGFDFDRTDKIITTDKEHNSNHVPWIMLHEEKGIERREVKTKGNGLFDLENFKNIMTEEVKLVSMYHRSNVDGTTIPAEKVAEITHDYDAILMLDGAQSVPHQPVDVQEIDVDLLAFSVHKMLGPTGIGVLYAKEGISDQLRPLIGGGGSVKNTTSARYEFDEPPAKFEGGLQNYAGLCAIDKTVEYLKKVGLENINKHEVELNKLATKELGNYVTIIGPKDPEKRGGIFNFYTGILGCHEISILLEESDILTRAGMQCVHSWYNLKKQKPGTRASFYLYNSKEEVKKFSDKLRELF